MKNILYFAIILSLAFATSCSKEKDTPVIGKVSFKTNQIWTIPAANGAPKQEWSDVVMASGAKKDNFNGDVADCRQNLTGYGDLFSWYAVDTYKNQLCPPPWRVPTKDDFNNLDKAMCNKNGFGRTDLTDIAKYLGLWGGAFGGFCYRDGGLYGQGSCASYWSATNNGTTLAHALEFTIAGQFRPETYMMPKNLGRQLRCVRD